MKYILNKETGEVHHEGCSYLPDKKNQVELGNFNSDDAALAKAKNDYPDLKPNLCGKCC